ncbi:MULTISPECIES: RodZ domain-containing protein [Shewanella]|uniref:RodZ domain-containing protein n=1 Tax=Shewanella TaxID=22 RepID=UPI001BC5EB6F|nr:MULTISPECIES: RodZ domain-containing protein [Shewanella]GIU50667.1 membrane protein [Shewanella sp. KT0246]
MTNNNNETSRLDENDTDQTELLEEVSTAGMLLRTAREAKGLSIEAVATQLHLRPSVIEDIENDIFDNISSATYARGYAKNYAKYVEADVEALQQCLAQQLPDETAAMQSFSRKTTRDARDSRLTIVTYLIILALLALLVVWWVQKDSLLSGIDLSKPTAEEVAAANVPVVSQTEDLLEPEIDPNMAYIEPSQMPVETTSAASADAQTVTDLANDATQSAEPAIETLQSASALVTNSAVTTDVVNTEIAQSTVEPLAANDAISMSFTADCWVNVVDATGKTLVDGVKGSSRVVEAKGVAPFKLILGAPQVVKIQFNGEDVSLADFSEGRVARLTLPRV